MKHPSILVAVAFLVAGTNASAQETPAAWVAKLGSGNYSEREAAARMLEKLGKAAMPALRDAIPTANLETKRRAIMLLEKIEERVILDDIRTATPVRLRFEAQSVADALPDVEKQLGLRFGSVAGKLRLAKLDTGTVPYWQAWQRFCIAARLQESDYARSAAKLKRMSESEAGDLMSMMSREQIEIHPTFSKSRLEFAADPMTDGYSVDDRHSVRVRAKWQALETVADDKMPQAVFAVEVRAEPRLEIVSLPRVEITKIVDDTGKTRAIQTVKFFPDTSHPTFLAAYVGEIQYGGLLHLKAIRWQGPACSLKELHGRVRMDVKVRPPMLEIPAVLKAVGTELRAYSGVTVKVLEADTNDDGDLRLRLRLTRLESLTPQTPEQQVVRTRSGVIAIRGVMDVALERLELLDSGGRKCPLVKSRYEEIKGKGYEAELFFATTGTQVEKSTLVMTKGSRVVPLDLPFLVREVAWAEKRN